MNEWSNPDTISAADAEQMASFLETRGSTPDQQRLYDALVEAIAPQAGENLLDVGCGTGIVTRRLAPLVMPEGRIVGLDISAVMVRAAQRLNTHLDILFEQGDVAALPYVDGSFDAIVAARLLLHVTNRSAVLTELLRVARHGGRLGMLEWDWGTLAIDHSQRALTRRILDWRCDHHGGENWMGRQLVRLCLESDWKVREVRPIVSVAREADTALVASLRRAAEVAQKHDIISVSEASSWLSEINMRLYQGSFFATINDYIIVAVSTRR